MPTLDTSGTYLPPVFQSIIRVGLAFRRTGGRRQDLNKAFTTFDPLLRFIRHARPRTADQRRRHRSVFHRVSRCGEESIRNIWNCYWLEVALCYRSHRRNRELPDCVGETSALSPCGLQNSLDFWMRIEVPVHEQAVIGILFKIVCIRELIL